jgi:hypothetical protein|tara:strand:+ start:444 stop:833 length:390 start_codon:yes stop_codon:yes gene_type:complete
MSNDTEVRTTTVTVWHRTDTVGGFIGWSGSKDPRLTFAYAYEIDPATMREELPHKDCFRINNCVTGESFEMPVLHETRSLSVGDLVRVAVTPRIANEAGLTFVEDAWNWAVEPAGWATITEEDFQRATA